MNKDFVLKTSAQVLDETAAQFEKSGRRVAELTNRMTDVVGAASSIWRGSSSLHFVSEFRMLNTDIDKLNSMINEHVRDLRNMAYNYNIVETRNTDSALGLSEDGLEHVIVPIAGIGAIFGPGVHWGGGDEWSDEAPFFHSSGGDSAWGGGSGGGGFRGSDDDGLSFSGKFDHELFKNDKHKVDIFSKNKDGYKVDYEKPAFGFEDKKSSEWSAWSSEDLSESDYAVGSYAASFSDAEAHSGWGAGLFKYEKDANGETVKRFAPGVNASAGASYSILSGSAEGRVGLGENHDLLGLNGSVDGVIGKAEAKAGASVSIFDKNPSVYAGANVEATAGKVGGKAGVTVLGTDVDVSGHIGYGIGGHAEIGFVDGKFKADVGLALGLAVDLGFEIDCSGTIEYIYDGFTSLIDTIF